MEKVIINLLATQSSGIELSEWIHRHNSGRDEMNEILSKIAYRMGGPLRTLYMLKTEYFAQVDRSPFTSEQNDQCQMNQFCGYQISKFAKYSEDISDVESELSDVPDHFNLDQ